MRTRESYDMQRTAGTLALFVVAFGAVGYQPRVIGWVLLILTVGVVRLWMLEVEAIEAEAA